MGQFNQKWRLIKKGIAADGLTLWHNTDGQAATSPKAMALLAGAVVIGVVGVSAMTTSPDSGTKSVETAIEKPVDILANLTDFRVLDPEDASIGTEVSLKLKPGQS